jgi:hypothetical protein
LAYRKRFGDASDQDLASEEKIESDFLSNEALTWHAQDLELNPSPAKEEKKREGK